MPVVYKNHTFNFPNIREVIQEISSKFNLSPKEVFVNDLDIGNINNAGVVIYIEGNPFYVVLDSEKEEVARLDVIEDPYYYLATLLDQEVESLIDKKALRQVLSETPYKGYLDLLEKKGAVSFLKEDLGLKGNDLYSYLVDNFFISPQELAFYIVDVYGASRPLSKSDEEFDLETAPGFVYYLYS